MRQTWLSDWILDHWGGPVKYDAYIASARWKRKAEAAKRRAGWCCQVCNTPGTVIPLHTHHRTYRRLGREKPADLVVLCEECHTLFHKRLGLRRRKK